jgi:hypothetical protein
VRKSRAWLLQRQMRHVRFVPASARDDAVFRCGGAIAIWHGGCDLCRDGHRVRRGRRARFRSLRFGDVNDGAHDLKEAGEVGGKVDFLLERRERASPELFEGLDELKMSGNRLFGDERCLEQGLRVDVRRRRRQFDRATERFDQERSKPLEIVSCRCDRRAQVLQDRLVEVRVLERGDN